MTPETISRNYDSLIVVRRWAATWLDFLLFAGALFVLLTIAGDHFMGGAVAAWFALVILYYPILEGLTGKTLGKLLCGLKVVDTHGANPGILKATIRTLLRLIEVNPLLLGGLPAGIAVLATPTRQRLGDKAADTYVLKSSDLALLTAPRAEMVNEIGYFPSTSPTGAPYLPSYPNAATPTYPTYNPPAPSTNGMVWALPGAIVTTLLTVGLIGGGIRAYQTADRDSRPISMSCKQFLQSPPNEGWYHVRECDFNIAEAAYKTWRFQSEYSHSDTGTAESGAITEVFIPVYATPDNDGQKTPFLLLTKDRQICSLVEQMRSMENADQKKIDAWVKAHFNELQVHKDITGTIQSGFEISDSLHDEIARLQQDRLAAHYVVLEEDGTPLFGAPIAAIVGGVFVGFIAFVFWIIVLISMVRRQF
jgi:uncharacterized RDD family membrane protein YckC